MRQSRRAFVRAASAAVVGSVTCLGGLTCTLDVPPAPTPTAAPSARAAGDELVIGVILSLSGRFSRQGALMKAGYQTWLDAVQRAGGLNVGGNPRAVRLVFQDDESEPLTAGQCVERLATDAGARLLLGPYSSQLTGAVAAAAEKAGLLVVAPDGTAPELFRRGFKLLVSVKPSDTVLLHGLADLAATVAPRAQPIGVLLSDELPITTEVAGFRERAAALGLNPIEIEPFAPGSDDLGAPLERLGQLAPRLLVIAANDSQIERLVSRVHDNVAPPPMRALTRLPINRDAAVPASRFDGVVSVEVWSPRRALSGPVLGSASEFAARFTRLHGYAPDVDGAAAAAAGLALQLGVERAGSVDPVRVRDAIGGLDQVTFWGRMAWNVDGSVRDAVVPVTQQRGDASVLVYPPELATSQVQYPLTGWPRL